MKSDLKEKLKAKGWSEEDISKAEGIMGVASERNKGNKLDLFVYWLGLIVAIIGNILVSGIIIPMVLMIRGIALYFMVFGISLFFGWIFITLIKDIENMETHHHIIVGLFIPAIALINLFMIITMANKVIRTLPAELKIPLANPLMLSIVYAFGFVIPYIIMKIREIKR